MRQIPNDFAYVYITTLSLSCSHCKCCSIMHCTQQSLLSASFAKLFACVHLNLQLNAENNVDHAKEECFANNGQERRLNSYIKHRKWPLQRQVNSYVTTYAVQIVSIHCQVDNWKCFEQKYSHINNRLNTWLLTIYSLFGCCNHTVTPVTSKHAQAYVSSVKCN